MNKNEKVRVLQVLDFINHNSGVSAVVMNYYEHLPQACMKCDFLLYEQAESDLESEILAKGSEIYVTGQPSAKNMRIYRRNVEKFFANHIREYDVVHVHIPNAAFIVLNVAKKYGVPVRIIHSHNARGADGMAKKVRNFVLNKWGICYANRYMACSKAAGEYLFGKKCCEKGQVAILNNAIPLEKYRYNTQKRNEIRKALGVGDEVLLGHVGRFAEQKNHDGLLIIFSKLCEQGWNGRLLLIGDGELRDATMQRAERLGIKEQIIFSGVVSNVNEYMSAMDIFLLPSLYEGLPVVCVEAQAAGLPCLISDKVSREIKLTKQVRFLELNNVQSWCDSIRELKIDKRDRNRTEINELENFDITKQAERLVTLYRSFIDK